jgi:ribosomal protein S12 methylthiotransferase
LTATSRVSVALVSLGCPKNLVDSEVMLGLLDDAGYLIVEEAEGADVIIVNTCAFIEPAVEEALDALLDLSELKHSGAKCLICAGCLTERYRDDLLEQLPEVDGFVGPGSVGEIVSIIERCLEGKREVVAAAPGWIYRADMPRFRSGAQWLANMKIADGCSHRCSYCMIPQLRGPYRSRPADDIGAEVAALIDDGVREICMIAQDTTAWGMDLPGDQTLAGLLSSLDLAGWDGWLRMQYLHPAGIHDDLLEAVASIPQVLPYFDIPLQHVDERVLRSMGRRGGASDYLEMIDRIRTAVPEAALRTTFIVGYPGETKEQFERLLEFVEEARFDRLSAFRYWDEPGTRAASLPDQVPEDEAADRLDELMILQASVSREINEQFIGRALQVLVEYEGEEEGQMVGRTYRDAPEVDGEVIVNIQHHKLPQPGEFIEATITGADEHDLYGELMPPQ